MTLAWLIVAMGVILYLMGWLNPEQNEAINQCIRAGKEWKDGNCG